LTETYGPAVICAWRRDWEKLPAQDRARLKARQGVRYQMLEGLDVIDPDTMQPVQPMRPLKVAGFIAVTWGSSTVIIICVYLIAPKISLSLVAKIFHLSK